MKQGNNELHTVYRVHNHQSGDVIEIACDPGVPAYINIKACAMGAGVSIVITREQAKLMIDALKQILLTPIAN